MKKLIFLCISILSINAHAGVYDDYMYQENQERMVEAEQQQAQQLQRLNNEMNQQNSDIEFCMNTPGGC